MAVANKKASFVTSDFEVFGKVQGVYFRKHTQKKATELGLKGWVMNTAQGTVVGQIQGPAVAVEDMKTWLQKMEALRRMQQIPQWHCMRYRKLQLHGHCSRWLLMRRT
ncbi:unnamed protein product [Spodoptera littoralis]|uniref:Acylphosphatase n=1 Tax=Spodoptera littoralis TaxID=7109 RepID=A0A9P0HZ70_SPOLI|nr:unnamed protein product [Spodoptera littoralis]CAH1638184.1 unnamed protein product [Spodoptera littoralis]